jgi:hypothetical protein
MNAFHIMGLSQAFWKAVPQNRSGSHPQRVKRRIDEHRELSRSANQVDARSAEDEIAYRGKQLKRLQPTKPIWRTAPSGVF